VNVHLVLLIVYSVALIAIGLWIARLVHSSKDFFVAGRQLGPALIFSTVLASNIGAGSTVGAAGLAYRDGIATWWWNGSAAIGTIFLALWIGPKIWRVAAEHNLYTAGDYLDLRYGGTVRGIITSTIWLGTLSILAGQLMAGAAVLSVVADMSRTTGIVVSAVVMTIYFVAGGLLSSAWVNAVQLVVLLAGFMIAVPLVLSQIGGLSALTSGPNAPSHFGDFFYSAGPGSGWTRLFLLGPAFIVSPGLLQKAYGAVDARAVRVGIGVQALVLALFAFIPVVLGMAARVSNPDIASPNLVLPTVLMDQLPPLVGALGLAAIYSAEVSTCDAILFMLSTSLSQDLYKRFIRPDASDRQLLAVARGAAVAGGIGGVVLAIQLATVIQALDIFYALLSVSLLMPVVGGLYVKRAGTTEALAAIGAGMTTLLIVRFGLVGGYPGLDPTLCGLVASAAAFFLVMAVRSKIRNQITNHESQITNPNH
jgi:SSS family solute:Na+ symporter